MGYRIEKEHYTIPKDLKRNIKLNDDDKKHIIEMYKTGEYSYRKLASIYGVAHKTIYYIINPHKYREFLDKRKKEKTSAYYYNKDKHREYMRRTREYRKTLEKQNLLEKEK